MQSLDLYFNQNNDEIAKLPIRWQHPLMWICQTKGIYNEKYNNIVWAETSDLSKC